MDTVLSSAIPTTTGLAARHCLSFPPETDQTASDPEQYALPETIRGPDRQRQWALASRRLSRLEQLIELDAPDVILRTEWHLVAAAFSSLENTEATDGMSSVA